MIVYAIKDGVTGDWWSRNHWGNPTSIPDLYSDRKRAESQAFKKGKCAFLATREWHAHRKPTIIQMNLTEAP